MTTSTASARETNQTGTTALVSFTLNGHAEGTGIPVSSGIPFPAGAVRDVSRLRLITDASGDIPAQFEPLAHWPDQSLRAVRLDFIAPREGVERYHLVESDAAPRKTGHPHLALRLDDHRIIATLEGRGDLELTSPLTLPSGKTVSPRWDGVRWLSRGPVRWAAELNGRFPRCRGLRFRLRVTAFAGTPHLELSAALLNSRRGVHRGGLWDLGDKNSIIFRSFEVIAKRTGSARVFVTLDPADQRRGPLERAKLYQDSSGGENWNSINHVNRAGVVPCRIRGYEYSDDRTPRITGNRAAPTMTLAGDQPLSLTVPHFWQQFPKALSAESGEIRAGLFPAEWNDDHEMQPGERKTHILWLSLSERTKSLDFAHDPPVPILPAEWYAQCRLFDVFSSNPADDSARLCEYISTAIDPEAGLAARREVIDEYGWRHWGDLWADHEQPSGENSPIISHYNNQYDVLEGCLRQFARSGNRQWRDLAAPLASHCIDIDVYHTDDDRAVYNHGLFWHTDHYQPARTAAHRTYSRENAAGRDVYGGGPSSSHCYSTGLLHLYYLTGESAYREAVLGLADWLIAMEDGSRTEFGLIDAGPTGVSTISAEAWYHGPGRGPANTLNTLVDAWELTGDIRYRDHAEMIIRRVVTPGENIDALELLDVERRWFYTLFLLALAKYLDAKQTASENDAAYGYAVSAARDYAAWMLDRERPYFDYPEQLEFPTETWGAQDIRKANAMRRLARYCEKDLADQVLKKAEAIADRGWHDLLRFESRGMLRPLAILLIEGLRDEYFRVGIELTPTSAAHLPERRSSREHFIPQRDRLRQNLRSPLGVLRAAREALNPRRWPNFVHAVRARL